MTSRAAATRYARALFDVALAERADLDRVDQDLSGFAALVAGNATLHRALTNPAIPAPRKRVVVEQLLEQSDGILAPVGKLLVLLAERDRLVLLPELAGAYRDRLMDHKKVVRAEVVTASDVPEERLQALQQGLARATGRQVHMESRIDPAILGGAVAKIGGTVYDGSITRQLEKMKQALTSAVE